MFSKRTSDNITRLYSPLREYCERLTKDGEKSIDLLHEIIETCGKDDRLEALTDCDQERYLKVAIFRSHIHKNSSFNRKFQLIGSELPISITSDESGITDQHLMHEKVDIAIKRLPWFEAQLLRLYLFDGMTHKQISKEVEIPHGYVKRKITYSITKLKDSLNVSC